LAVILLCLPLYVTYSFSYIFQYTFLLLFFWILNVLTVICFGVVIFWFYLLGAWKTSSAWIIVSFSIFVKFCPIVLLNMLFIPIAWTYSHSSMPIICRFVLLIVS
jgi:hypothetical protein